MTGRLTLRKLLFLPKQSLKEKIAEWQVLPPDELQDFWQESLSHPQELSKKIPLVRGKILTCQCRQKLCSIDILSFFAEHWKGEIQEEKVVLSPGSLDQMSETLKRALDLT